MLLLNGQIFRKNNMVRCQSFAIVGDTVVNEKVSIFSQSLSFFPIQPDVSATAEKIN
jgi:hypothetical protein